MTSEQKNQIVLMHNQGYGYKKIAAGLAISPNTVKSWLKLQVYYANFRTEKDAFCCRDCCQKWFNMHLNQIQQKAIYSFTCLHCGKEFTAYGNNHRNT